MQTGNVGQQKEGGMLHQEGWPAKENHRSDYCDGIRVSSHRKLDQLWFANLIGLTDGCGKPCDAVPVLMSGHARRVCLATQPVPSLARRM